MSPMCEKCWRDSAWPYDHTERYFALVKERDAAGQVCTPEEQAGEWWDAERQCDRRTPVYIPGVSHPLGATSSECDDGARAIPLVEHPTPEPKE